MFVNTCANNLLCPARVAYSFETISHFFFIIIFVENAVEVAGRAAGSISSAQFGAIFKKIHMHANFEILCDLCLAFKLFSLKINSLHLVCISIACLACSRNTHDSVQLGFFAMKLNGLDEFPKIRYFPKLVILTKILVSTGI